MILRFFANHCYIVKWVTESMRPFSIVEDQEFHTLMKTGRICHIPSADTVARDVKQVFKKTKARISTFLQEYDRKLSFATDGWTSPNHKAYVAITVHFLKDGVPYHRMNFREQLGSLKNRARLVKKWVVRAFHAPNSGTDIDLIFRSICNSEEPDEFLSHQLC